LIIYTIKQGDSIYSIARRYGVTPQSIIAGNGLENTERLMIGQALVIPTDNVRYVVKQGDSLYSISRNFNTTIPAIIAANPGLTESSVLNIGQVIIIPPSKQLRTIDVNGYAFPSINSTTLTRTLPHLTFISIFSYQVRPDGSLVPINDNTIIQTARQQRVAPLMVITNIEEGGSFSSELAHTILTNEQIQNTLINNVITTLRKGYTGLDIDFEYIFPQDRVNYNNFVRKVADRLHPMGYTITTSLAPKFSDTQRGLLYEAHDYAFHGRVSDHVIIMTYEWGYTFSEQQPVAPVNQVERVLKYATSVIPSRKILMGIPNYGYDWTLPYVQGSAAKTISHTAAINLAAREEAQIQYNTEAQAPFFEYYDDNRKRHIVWFEDARSIQAKLNLVNKYNLGGVSYWTINSFFPQNWLVLESMYNVNKVL
jgi:spore germination protein